MIGLRSIRRDHWDDGPRDLHDPVILLKEITKAADMNTRPRHRDRRDNPDRVVVIVQVADGGVVVGVCWLFVVVVMRIEMPMSDIGVA